MRNGLGCELKRAASRLVLAGFVGSLAAACSTDTMRLSDNPFSNPFRTAAATPEPSLTGSLPDRPAAAPASTVRSAPLAPVATAPKPAPARLASTGSPGWSAAGGTTITVGSADTLSTISNRYGVPESAILSANGITAGQVAAGRRLIVPVYSATGAAAPVRTVEASPPSGRVVATQKVSVVKPAAAKTMAQAAAQPAKPRPGQAFQAAAKADPKAAAKDVRQVAKADAKGGKPETKGAVKEAATKASAAQAAKVAEKAKAAEQPKVAAAAPVKAAPAPAKAAEPVKQAEAPKPAAKEPESTGTLGPSSSADFRWPARGRVISGFGNGSNEGINIAVPDGTPVKAAGDGVVAYAGSEVKGYGNLVLIRHDNGYVSAYAHNGELDVKRGQKVSRGQTIAKAGQTGNVTSPQLHFEIRKGSTPVDPMRYLASAN